MKIYDAHQLVSIKTSSEPCKVTLYNMNQLHISNIFFNNVKNSHTYSILQMTPATTILPEEQYSEFYYLPISSSRKTLELDTVLLFTAKKRLNIAKFSIPIVFCSNADRINRNMEKIIAKIGWEHTMVDMNLSEFSQIPSPRIDQNIHVKYWNNLLVVFDENHHQAVIYAPGDLLKKASTFLTKAKAENFADFNRYFSLGHEFALCVDYVLMDKEDELKVCLSKINTLLESLGIDYKFKITKETLESLSPEKVEAIQSQIISKYQYD